MEKLTFILHKNLFQPVIPNAVDKFEKKCWYMGKLYVMAKTTTTAYDGS